MLFTKGTYAIGAMALALGVPGAAYADGPSSAEAPTAAQNAANVQFEGRGTGRGFGNAYGYGQGNGASSGNGNGNGHDQGHGRGHDDHGNGRGEGHCKYDDNCHASPG